MDWMREEKKYIFRTYRRQPLVLLRGKGSYVWDENGKKYLDFFSGLAVNNLGHCPPAVARAVRLQVETLVHTSNLYYTVPQIECAKTLVQRTFAGKVFFCNSGAEANECAIKVARRWGKERGGGHGIVAFENSFHGRTMGALTLTGQEKYRRGFDPLLEGVRYARFNDLESVRGLLGGSACAVIVEPVQGEGGVVPADRGFLKALRRLCDQRGLLLIFDEVQSGLGRTGRLFAYQHYGVQPDLLTVAKGLGGGLAIGACIAKDEAAEMLGPGDHASTFGGSPLACAAASAVLKALNPPLLRSVQKKGRALEAELNRWKRKHPRVIREVRGLGLMLGVELFLPGAAVVDACRDGGLLINCTQDTVLRLLPPLTVSLREMRSALKVLERALGRAAGAA